MPIYSAILLVPGPSDSDAENSGDLRRLPSTMWKKQAAQAELPGLFKQAPSV